MSRTNLEELKEKTVLTIYSGNQDLDSIFLNAMKEFLINIICSVIVILVTSLCW